MSSTAVDPSAQAIDLALDARRTRGLRFIGLAVAGVGFALTLQLGLNSNFVGEELKLTGQQQGILEAFRETCGITALFLLALLAGLAEPIIASVMLCLLALGLSAYSIVPDFWWLVAASLLWSQGFHVWTPLPASMTLALAEPGQAGRRLGQISAAGAAGSAGGLIVALVLHKAGLAMRPLWLLGGAAALFAALACLFIPRNIKTPGQRLVIRKEYSLYYLLCFLEGWRKQIFVAFAGFLLVRQYGVPLTTMLLLFMAIQAISWIASPHVGRLLDRYGERRILALYYAGLVVVFSGYACLTSRPVLCTLFVIDSALSVFAMGLTTYINRIAPKADHTPTLSLGVAINHVAAVAMPLIGGLLWAKFGYQWAFLLGTIVALLSIPVALMLPTKQMQNESTAEG